MTIQHREAALPDGAAVAPDQTIDHAASDTSGRAPLSCTRIIEAAVRYVDDNCLDELSMRRLGSELGVEAMSLYRYFPSKAALLEAVAGRLLRDLQLPDDANADAWEEQIRAFAVSFRAITREHPRLVPLLSAMSPEDAVPAGIHERMVGVWRRAGLSETDSRSAQRALQSYLSGSSQWHQESCMGRAAEHDFRYGLDVFLDGVRTRVAEAGGAT
ncbi:MAG: TetR/AcrR family transcriptional regulator [Chloroflexi bacterium]|nr:TetR/AcrR family transcriptional regulator [Chloroflexota bacterium]